MTEEDIKRFLARIIDVEGRDFTNDPDDLGGATRFGITQATLGEARKLGRLATPAEVQALEQPEAEDIYRREWIGHADLRIGLVHDIHKAWFIFDTAVLFGQRRAGIFANRAAGKLGVEDSTVDVPLVNKVDRAAFLVAGVELRISHHAKRVRKDPSQARFIVGWVDRAHALQSAVIGRPVRWGDAS